MAHDHLIYRQILEISFSSKKEAMAGQHKLSDMYRNELMPLMNEVFDEVLSTNHHIRVDRLEIDLGTLSPRILKENIKQVLRKKLEDELLKDIQKISFLQHLNGDAETPPLDQYQSEGISMCSSERSDIEQFIFFIKTGQLPWWTVTDQGKSLEALANTLIERQPHRLLDLLSDFMSSDTYSRRIIHQFPDRILIKFLELKQLKMGNRQQILNLHKDFYRIHRHRQLIPLNRSNFRLLLWQIAFEFWLLRSTSTLNNANFIDKDLRNHSSPVSERKTFSLRENVIEYYLLYLIDILTGKIKTSTQSGKDPHPHLVRVLMHRMMDPAIQHETLGKVLNSILAISSSYPENIQTISDIGQIKKISGNTNKEETEAEARKLLAAEKAFEIRNAGLVIIAPFLPRFFDNLGLINDKLFVTNDAAQRAALLLQYITTGKTDMPEYDLLLNKILCGLPINEPLARSLEISDIEKEEVTNLLQSVVEHWEALKGTSIEGLRQTFLAKDGLLNQDMNGWKLRVERTTVDILLDRLPWSISIIKLPWNNEMIHVEW